MNDPLRKGWFRLSYETRLLLIGCGRWGLKILQTLKLQPGVIVDVLDPDPFRLKSHKPIGRVWAFRFIKFTDFASE